MPCRSHATERGDGVDACPGAFASAESLPPASGRWRRARRRKRLPSGPFDVRLRRRARQQDGSSTLRAAAGPEILLELRDAARGRSPPPAPGRRPGRWACPGSRVVTGRDWSSRSCRRPRRPTRRPAAAPNTSPTLSIIAASRRSASPSSVGAVVTVEGQDVARAVEHVAATRRPHRSPALGSGRNGRHDARSMRPVTGSTPNTRRRTGVDHRLHEHGDGLVGGLRRPPGNPSTPPWRAASASSSRDVERPTRTARPSTTPCVLHQRRGAGDEGPVAHGRRTLPHGRRGRHHRAPRRRPVSARRRGAWGVPQVRPGRGPRPCRR